jgi:hypothetical protein
MIRLHSLAKLESDIEHIRSDIAEIKDLLDRLSPRIIEMCGTVSRLGNKEDLAKISAEIERRPMRRKTVVDVVALIVVVIGALITIRVTIV